MNKIWANVVMRSDIQTSSDLFRTVSILKLYQATTGHIQNISQHRCNLNLVLYFYSTQYLF